MRSFTFAVVAGLLAPLVSLADDVHLTNGRIFEDVVAEVEGEQVLIRLGFGELRVSASDVERVEKSSSPLEEFLARKASLEAGDDAAADPWLRLARWALAHDLRTRGREAALVAAELDAHLPGLDLVLQGFDFVFDEEARRWLPYPEFMRRRGYVLFEGEWMTFADRATLMRAWHAERLAAAEARQAAALEQRRIRVEEERIRRAEAAERAASVAPYGLPLGVVYAVPQIFFAAPVGPVVVQGGIFSVPDVHAPRAPRSSRPADRVPSMSLLERAPGSLIPGHLSLSSHSGGGH